MRSLITVLFATLLFEAFAQFSESPPDCILQLRDGSVLVGHLVGEDPPKILFEIATGDTIAIWQALIRRQRSLLEGLSIYRAGRYQFTRGIFGQIAAGVTSGEWSGGTHLHLAAGKRITPRLAAGLGVGLDELYGGATFTYHNLITLYALGRYELNMAKTRLVGNLRLGYGFKYGDSGRAWPLDYRARGGLYVSPSLALRFATRGRVKWGLEWYMHLQRTTSHYTLPNNDNRFGPSHIKEKLWFVRMGPRLLIEYN